MAKPVKLCAPKVSATALTLAVCEAAEDYAKNKIPDALVLAAGGDRDRARVIWTYMKLKNEFPTTFQEARSPVVLPGVPPILPRSVFLQQLPNLPLPTTPEQAVRQSAACLYVSLTQAGVRGVVMGTDGMNQQIADLPLDPANPASPPARMFVDSWGQPIAFVRMAFPDEVQGPPHVRGGANVSSTEPVVPG